MTFSPNFVPAKISQKKSKSILFQKKVIDELDKYHEQTYNDLLREIHDSNFEKESKQFQLIEKLINDSGKRVVGWA